MNGTLIRVVVLLAQEPPRDTGPDFGKASPFGLLIVVLLLIGTFLLIWSMNRHLRKLPESFENENPEANGPADEGTVEQDPSPDNGSPRREPGG